VLGTFFRSGRCALQADRAGGQLDEAETMRKEFACPLYDSPAIVYPQSHFGAAGFRTMAALSMLAMPFIVKLRRKDIRQGK
jgi:hypothetical protein